MLKYLRLNLGLPTLLPEWRQFFTTRYLLNDLSAGVTVACVAIPLSLAIALASGVSPAVGLVTAIIGGIVCALFGGTPLAVSGPAAAMSILIAHSVVRFGMKGIVFICLMLGLMQMVSGILRLGRLSRFVPLPVIAAFTSGIGVIILIGQLPRILGLPPTDQSHIFSMLTHLAPLLSQIKPSAVAIVLLTLAIIRLLPKIYPRIPSTLVAVIIATGLVHLLSLKGVAVIGDIPRSLPAPHLPSAPSGSVVELILSSFTIYLLACLETLLSSSALDKLTKKGRHDPDQELIGQGLGNMVSSLFGGIPITGVIARSALNVKAGAKTRRAAIVHSIILLLTVYFAGPAIGMIPIAALAGVLVSVAISMIDYVEFRNLLRTSKSEAGIYGITFLTIIFVDLTAGVQIGILAACLILLVRASKSDVYISSHSDDAMRLSLVGPLTFLSLSKIAKLEKKLHGAAIDLPIIIDLSQLTDLDTSGAASMGDFISAFHGRGYKIYMKGLAQRFEAIFSLAGTKIPADCYITSETELKDKENSTIQSFHGRLKHGVHKYHAARLENRKLHDMLATQQDPHTLFVTCSDSRILTSMITQADPGELFIVRNVGNFVPPYDDTTLHGEAAALDFALTKLDIREIVVCGHSNCGAIQACCGDDHALPKQLRSWVEMIRIGLNTASGDVSELSRQNVLNQIEHLRQYPVVRDKLADGSLNIHGWFIDLEQGMIYEWQQSETAFVPIGHKHSEEVAADIGLVEERVDTYN